MAYVEIYKNIGVKKIARQMLKGTFKKKKLTAAQKKALTAKLAKKIRRLGGGPATGKFILQRGEVYAVGKKKTKKFGKLIDPNLSGGPKDKWAWWTPLPPFSGYSSPDIKDIKPPVRIADPDIITFNDDLLDIDIMSDMIFEGIGGHEIINIARNDIVNGQPVSYQPIRNLNQLALDYNSGTLLANEDANKTIFDDFGIKFEDKLPIPGFNDAGDLVANLGTGPSGEIVYLESLTGDIVINVTNLRLNERIEIDLINSLDSFNDTIYVESES